MFPLPCCFILLYLSASEPWGEREKKKKKLVAFESSSPLRQRVAAPLASCPFGRKREALPSFFPSFLPSSRPGGGSRGGAGQGRSVRPAARPSPSGCPPGSRPPRLRRQRPPSFPKNDNNNYYCCSLLLVKGRLRVWEDSLRSSVKCPLGILTSWCFQA